MDDPAKVLHWEDVRALRVVVGIVRRGILMVRRRLDRVACIAGTDDFVLPGNRENDYSWSYNIHTKNYLSRLLCTINMEITRFLYMKIR